MQVQVQTQLAFQGSSRQVAARMPQALRFSISNRARRCNCIGKKYYYYYYNYYYCTPNPSACRHGRTTWACWAFSAGGAGYHDHHHDLYDDGRRLSVELQPLRWPPVLQDHGCGAHPPRPLLLFLGPP